MGIELVMKGDSPGDDQKSKSIKNKGSKYISFRERCYKYEKGEN